VGRSRPGPPSRPPSVGGKASSTPRKRPKLPYDSGDRGTELTVASPESYLFIDSGSGLKRKEKRFGGCLPKTKEKKKEPATR